LSHSQKKVPEDIIHEFETLIKHCLKDNICFFRNKIYNNFLTAS